MLGNKRRTERGYQRNVGTIGADDLDYVGGWRYGLGVWVIEGLGLRVG